MLDSSFLMLRRDLRGQCFQKVAHCLRCRALLYPNRAWCVSVVTRTLHMEHNRYRKTFTIPDDWSDMTFWLQFEGVFRETMIFLNGKNITAHDCGYTGFSVRLVCDIFIVHALFLWA